MASQVYLYNTMSRSVEPLQTLEPGLVRMYCCGPTVYNYQHIGNLRTYIFEDLLARMLRYAGYEVKHVMNITDVGHLVSDADEGEDKMSVAAKREGKSSLEIAKFYTDVFFEHCSWLQIERPTVVCKATDHIVEMIGLIKRLEEGGFAYQAGGNVYFDVSKLPDYGKLARHDFDSLKAGARIEVDSNKRNAFDFALWFTKSKFENQELQWDSPWGRGYPGWHIECSAMSMRYLGEHFDIHCGGVDHIPVHHTNEIAQSEAATGKPFATTWIHGGFLVTDKEKMSKSTGTFLTLDLLKERRIDPLAYRLFCLAGNYRQELPWSWEAVENAANALRKLRFSVMSWKQDQTPSNSHANTAVVQELRNAFAERIFNDLGTAKALAVVYELVNNEKLNAQAKLELFLEFDRVLGLGAADWEEQAADVPEEVRKLAEEREAARQKKDWKLADELRERILGLGFVVEDSKGGFQIKPRS